jgi:hypothetical protein
VTVAEPNHPAKSISFRGSKKQLHPLTVCSSDAKNHSTTYLRSLTTLLPSRRRYIPAVCPRILLLDEDGNLFGAVARCPGIRQ